MNHLDHKRLGICLGICESPFELRVIRSVAMSTKNWYLCRTRDPGDELINSIIYSTSQAYNIYANSDQV